MKKHEGKKYEIGNGVPCVVRVHEGAKKGKKRKYRGGALYKYPKNLGGEKGKNEN